MPYIDKNRRSELSKKLKEIDNFEMIGLLCETQGDLNYMITKICHGYLNKFGMIKYSRINDIIGAIEAAKLEFYRREASPYEDKKIFENGDV